MPGMRIAIVLPAIAVLATGCATRDWVTRIVSKERIETDGRVSQVEQRVDVEGRRISGNVEALGDQVKTVQQATDANLELATGAKERADGALTKATDVDGRLTRLWATRHRRSVVDSTKVHFGFDRFDLDDGAQTALRAAVDELKKNPALAVVLEGYTDPRGTRSYNLELARRRVESVQRYLVSKGVEMWRINALGFGPLDTATVADAEKRRVTVTLTVAE